VPSPQLRFVELEHQFGEVETGKSVEHEFAFTNTGPGVLAISKVTTGCGCTAALATAREVPSGGTGKVKVTFQTTGYKGQTTKQAYVESNDPRQPKVTLSLNCTVKVALDSEPPHYYFGTIAYGTTANQTIRVFSPQGQAFHINRLTPASPSIRCSEVRPSAKGGYEFDITVGPGLPVGQFSASVVAETDCPRQPRLVIGVFGNIGPAETAS